MRSVVSGIFTVVQVQGAGVFKCERMIQDFWLEDWNLAWQYCQRKWTSDSDWGHLLRQMLHQLCKKLVSAVYRSRIHFDGLLIWRQGTAFHAFTRVASIDHVYFYPKYSKAIAINQALICLACLPQSQWSSLSYMSKVIFQVRFGTKTSKWGRAIFFWSSSLHMWCYPSCHWADKDKLATFSPDQGWPEAFITRNFPKLQMMPQCVQAFNISSHHAIRILDGHTGHLLWPTVVMFGKEIPHQKYSSIQV